MVRKASEASGPRLARISMRAISNSTSEFSGDLSWASLRVSIAFCSSPLAYCFCALPMARCSAPWVRLL